MTVVIEEPPDLRTQSPQRILLGIILCKLCELCVPSRDLPLSKPDLDDVERVGLAVHHCRLRPEEGPVNRPLDFREFRCRALVSLTHEEIAKSAAGRWRPGAVSAFPPADPV